MSDLNPQTESQFVVAIAVYIAKAGFLDAKASMPRARDAYSEFLKDAGVPFGHPEYAWDDDAARSIAAEYETGHWA